MYFVNNSSGDSKMFNKNNSLWTDLVVEKNSNLGEVIFKDKCNKLMLTRSDNKKYSSSTISFDDILNKDNYYKVQNLFVEELSKYLKLSSDDTILVIGLGNDKSTPDSLGPLVSNNILVTRYLYLLGQLSDDYSNVCTFIPNVMGNTGIETSDIIKSIIKETNSNKVIVVDSLKTNSMNRLLKTIQITNQGISPGSGIDNKREEISKETLGVDVIAIGVPTVIDIRSLFNNKSSINYIVTPTNIDFLIDKFSLLIGNGINLVLHKNFIRQNNII